MKRTIDGISVMSELGAGTRGSSLGLQALQIAEWNAGGNLFNTLKFDPVPTENNLIYKPVNTPNAIRIAGIARMYEKISARVKQSLSNGDFPFIIAGDHSSAGGTIAGIKAAYPKKRLGVVWVDAHADLHSPYTTPSGNVHGMPLATALGVNNEERQINEVSHIALDAWNLMKGAEARVKPEDLVFIAVRDTEEPENFLLDKLGIRNIETSEVRENGGKWAVETVQEQLKDCDLVYISFDVDSMDCDLISRGTGTPVSNGLTEEEATEIMRGFAAWDKVECMEMVEINPTLDEKGNVMAETSYRVLVETINELNKR